MKRLITAIAVLLALTMSVMSPMPALAAPRKTYLADVMTYSAKSFDEARQGLEKKGYTIVDDSNLNTTMSTGVYLGYKTTEDPNEAITDLAVMNMNGDFSEAAYKNILAEHRKEIETHIRTQLAAIAAFQTNYKNGSNTAKGVYTSLNNFIDDKAGKNAVPMGDLLLNFDFSDAAVSDLTDTFMKGNAQIIRTVETLLTLASETAEDTFLERMLDTCYDDIEESFCEEYGDYDLATNKMSAMYDEAARDAVEDWEAFRRDLLNIRSEYMEENADGSLCLDAESLDEENIEQVDESDGLTEEQVGKVNAVIDLTNKIVSDSIITDVCFYCLLDELEFDGGTLLDFFTRPSAELELYEIYPLVASMNENQRAQIKVLGLKTLLMTAFSDMQHRNTAEKDLSEDEMSEPVSVYTDVDVSIFEDGVAVTGQASKHETLSGENWFLALLDGSASFESYDTATIVTSAVCLVSLCVYTVAWLKYAAYDQQVKNQALEEVLGDRGVSVWDPPEWEGTEKVTKAMKELYGENIGKELGIPEPVERCGEAVAARNAIGSTTGEIMYYLKCVSFFIVVISFIADVYFIWRWLTKKNAPEDPIPHHLVTVVNTAEKGDEYVYYKAAVDQNGEAADLNCHKGEKHIGWLTLYFTKDKRAGCPIIAESLRVQHGFGTGGAGEQGLHLFNESAAVNVTSKQYTGYADSKEKSAYVFFKNDLKAYTANVYTASAFTFGALAAAAGGGLLLGLAAGLVPTAISRARKKKETEESTDNA